MLQATPEPPPVELDAETSRKLDKWVEAKRNRNFSMADTLRSELEAKGIRPEQVRPHVWEPPGSRRGAGSHGSNHGREAQGSSFGTDARHARHGAQQQARGDFGYVPPARDDYGISLRENSGKLVAQEGKIIPVTGKAVDGAFRPPGMRLSGEKRTGEGGGFKEFDDMEEDRRKRRAMEERALVAERKAEKKKCEYCKRASCIC